MNTKDETDRRLQALFEAQRRADRATPPGFRSLVDRGRSERRLRLVAARAVRVAAFATAGSVAVAAAAVWLYVQAPGKVTPTETRPNAVEVIAPEVTTGHDTLPAPRPVPEPAALPEEPSPPREAARDSDPVVEIADAVSREVVKQPAASAGLADPAPSPPDVSMMTATSAAIMDEPHDEPEESRFVQQLAAADAYARAVEQAETRVPGDRPEVTVLTGEFVQDVPVEGRLHQNVLTLAPGRQDAAGERRRAVERAGEVVLEVGSGFNTEAYDLIRETGFISALDQPRSTFSIDVDTASYANVRRFLTQGRLPPRDSVRIEEMINYFHYDYPLPGGGDPFSASVEVADCPWNPAHRLARIGLKGREVDRDELAGSNLVFLIDVSGSMDPPNKLPLLKSALALLLEQLDDRDQIAVVAYAGGAELVLPSTPGSAKGEILAALDRLAADGGTNGGSGLRLAYRIARENFIRGGVNRVILATDGDFNLGVTDRAALLRLIEKDAKRGIFLTTLGVGMGNYKDGMLETLADRGNGNYAYVDSLREARKVLVEQIGGTLITIAKDVKIQVEFNPAEVAAYRLIGYENRMLRDEEFNDDERDAGEVGSGHTVTALYEIVLPGAELEARPVDPLKYQAPAGLSERAKGGELLTLKLRYKEPEGRESRLLEFSVIDAGGSLDDASDDFRFAAAVAEFGLLLRGSRYLGHATATDALALAEECAGTDEHGYRSEFAELIHRAMAAGL